MVKTNFLTEKETERMKRNESIVKRYIELKTENPELSDNRLYSFIAKEINFSVPGIRKIIIRYQE